MLATKNVRTSLRAVVCAASLGLALSCAGLAAPALADEAAPAPFGMGTGTAIVDDSTVSDPQLAFVGSWSVEDLVSVDGDPAVHESFEMLVDAGMSMDLTVNADGTFEFVIVSIDGAQSVEGAWAPTDEGVSFDFDGEQYIGVVEGDDLVLTGSTDEMQLVRTGGGPEEAVDMSEAAGFARSWELSGFEIEGLGDQLGAIAISILGSMDVVGSLDVSPDGTYIFMVTGGNTGHNLVYHGTWEAGGVDQGRFMDPDGNFEVFMSAEIVDGKLYMRGAGMLLEQAGLGQLGDLGSLVFTPVHRVPDREAAAAEAVEEPALPEEAAPEAVAYEAVEAQDLLVAQLPYNEGTGYEWTCEIADENIIELGIQQAVTEEEGGVVGSPMTEIFALTPLAAGQTDVTFTFARPWEASADDVVITCTVEVAADGTAQIVSLDCPAEYAEYVFIY